MVVATLTAGVRAYNMPKGLDNYSAFTPNQVAYSAGR